MNCRLLIPPVSLHATHTQGEGNGIVGVCSMSLFLILDDIMCIFVLASVRLVSLCLVLVA